MTESMKARMFYFSKLAENHHFDRYEAEQDWKRAEILEKAYKVLQGPEAPWKRSISQKKKEK